MARAVWVGGSGAGTTVPIHATYTPTTTRARAQEHHRMRSDMPAAPLRTCALEWGPQCAKPAHTTQNTTPIHTLYVVCMRPGVTRLASRPVASHSLWVSLWWGAAPSRPRSKLEFFRKIFWAVESWLAAQIAQNFFQT